MWVFWGRQRSRKGVLRRLKKVKSYRSESKVFRGEIRGDPGDFTEWNEIDQVSFNNKKGDQKVVENTNGGDYWRRLMVTSLAPITRERVDGLSQNISCYRLRNERERGMKKCIKGAGNGRDLGGKKDGEGGQFRPTERRKRRLKLDRWGLNVCQN